MIATQHAASGAKVIPVAAFRSPAAPKTTSPQGTAAAQGRIATNCGPTRLTDARKRVPARTNEALTRDRPNP